MNIILLIARILFSAVFILAGFGHIMNPGEMTEHVKSKGIPLPTISVFFAGLLNLVGGLSIMLGYQVQIGALLLIAFLIPAAFIMHNFWSIEDPMQQQNERIHFMKDLSLAGGAYLIWHLYMVAQHVPLSLS